jgi:NAD(P)H-flavin reductase
MAKRLNLERCKKFHTIPLAIAKGFNKPASMSSTAGVGADGVHGHVLLDFNATRLDAKRLKIRLHKIGSNSLITTMNTVVKQRRVAELIELAKQMREGHQRSDKLGLTDDEVAFYDALEVNDSAVKVPGEPTLKDIARAN